MPFPTSLTAGADVTAGENSPLRRFTHLRVNTESWHTCLFVFGYL